MAQDFPLLMERVRETKEPAGRSLADTVAVHEQAQRILSDPLFHNSKRYSDMLRYIVDRTLDGRHDCLKERIIGIEVFERPPDYDTSVDSIVRVAAAEVRKRLARYYQAPAHDHELRIDLPTRCYVAEFKQPEQIVQAATSAMELPVPREQPIELVQASTLRQRSLWPTYLWVTVAASVLVAAGWGVRRIFAPAPALERFWAPMLSNSNTTLIAIGSPVWVMLSPPAATTAPREPDTSLSGFITHQVNFPMADLTSAVALNSFLGHRGRDSVIRLSDSTTLSDLHGGPLIILGSFPNEWALRLGSNLPFEFRADGGLQWIADTSHPDDRRWMVNIHSPVDQVTSEYALITRAVDQTTGQWWVGIGGVTVLGTLAAQKIMIDPKEMTAFAAALPKDWDRKNLQIVVDINMVKGSPGAWRVVATRSW